MPQAAIQYDSTRSERSSSVSEWRQGLAGRLLVETHGVDQLQPGVFADADHPVAVTRPVEGGAQDGAQQTGVEHLGQELVADAAEGFGDEAGIRQDAGVGVQLGVAMRSRQPVASAPRRAERNSGWLLQEVAEGLQIPSRGLEVVRVGGPDFVDQEGEQGSQIGVRIGKEALRSCSIGLGYFSVGVPRKRLRSRRSRARRHAGSPSITMAES
jgi:hypothetical protein